MKGKEIRIYSLLVIDTAFFFLEIIVGYAVHSLALVADSFHMLNDIFSLIVALWAVKVSQSRGVDSKYTYGWQRAEILGALINGVFLVALCLSIFLEAVQRFVEPQVISNPVLILCVGAAGLVSNLVGLVLFHEHGHSHSHGGGDSHGDVDVEAHSHSHSSNPTPERVGDLLPEEQLSEQTALLSEDSTSYNTNNRNRSLSETHQNHYHSKPKVKAGGSSSNKSLNMHGVWLHVLGDALGNIGVMATALFIWKTDYSWKFYMDPAISLVITVIIFSSAMPLCRRASSILLQGVPQSVNAEEVKEDLESLPGVEDIHDLHIWILKEDLFIATLHVSVSLSESEFMDLASKINGCLYGHGIHSTTIQPEFLTTTTRGTSDNNSVDNSPPLSKNNSRASSIHSSDDNNNRGGCIVGGKKSSGGLKSKNRTNSTAS